MTWELLAVLCQIYVIGLLIWMALALAALCLAVTQTWVLPNEKHRVEKWSSRMFLISWAWPPALLVGVLLGIRKAAIYLVDKANFEEFWKEKK